LALGLPILLFSRSLPQSLQQAAEAVIGGIIVALAIRLLMRWRRGYFHVHPHRHGAVYHVHPHRHETARGHTEHPVDHTHVHAERLGRSPAASFGIGLVHGIGGSAGSAVVLMGTVGGRTQGVLMLLLFAAATAASMALLSVALAHTLTHGIVRRRLSELVPVLGTAGVIFGAWYSLGALQGWN
jgi:cytochrome c biogenesis protein CcdA